MNVPNLGRLERVELQNAWNSESRDFTPWLAKIENLELLGEVIGLELELEAQEKFVGPFRADILCKEVSTKSWVLIENQLERTDHSHLGQLHTYAAGLKVFALRVKNLDATHFKREELDSTLNEYNSPLKEES